MKEELQEREKMRMMWNKDEKEKESNEDEDEDGLEREKIDRWTILTKTHLSSRLHDILSLP